MELVAYVPGLTLNGESLSVLATRHSPSTEAREVASFFMTYSSMASIS